MKRIICLILTLLLLCSLAACGGEDGKSGGSGSSKSTQALKENGAFYFGSQVGKEKLQANASPLDPAQVYSSITYDERMLYGRFVLENEEKSQEEYAKKAVYEDLEYSEIFSIYTAEENLTTQKLSTMPVAVDMGTSACNYGRKLRGEHEWATLYLLNESGTKIDVLCTYTVSGNTVSFFPLDGYTEEQDENYLTSKIIYTVGSDSIDYTFEIQGTSLKLTRGSETVTLKTWYFADDDKYSVCIGGYAAEGSALIENLDSFSCTIYKDGDMSSVYLNDTEGNLYADSLSNACVSMTEEGLLSFYWETEDENEQIVEHLYHFVYFPGDGYSMSLTDGSTVYYYTESSTSRDYAAIGEGMTAEELAQLQGMSESDINAIVQKKANLLEDLAAAYEEADLNVSINTVTGEIALDSTVLFGYDQSDISADGKAFLQKFTQIYTSVVYSEEYAGFVSRILVEGHTDPTGAYDYNLTLSQARADSVKNYCLSDECGVDSAYVELFGQSLEAVGYSCDKPIYDTNGNVDNDASRRVSFRFIISLTQE